MGQRRGYFHGRTDIPTVPTGEVYRYSIHEKDALILSLLCLLAVPYPFPSRAALTAALIAETNALYGNDHEEREEPPPSPLSPLF